MRLALLALLFAAGLCQAPASSAADTAATRLNGGLEATINWAARDQTTGRTAISATIINTGRQIVYLAHIGPILVVDNGGTSYKLPAISGVTDCSGWGGGEECLKNTLKNDAKFVNSLTQIDPNVPITMNFTFASGREPATVVSLATVFVVRFVDDPLRDDTLTDEQKVRQLKRMNVSFPAATITRSK